jgi:hypothetical protein
MPYLGKEPARVPVTAADIPDDSITAAKILDGVITAADIAAGAVDTAELAADAVEGSKIADNAIESEHIAAGSVDNAHLATGIDAAKLTTGTIPIARIADDAVTNAKLATGITASKLTGALPAIDGSNLTGVASTPASISDTANTSTGYFDLPAGTTAQRPGSPATGHIRYSTTFDSTEYYNGTAWVVANMTPTVTSVTGTIYAGSASTLTIVVASNTDSVDVLYYEGSTLHGTDAGRVVSSGSLTSTVPSTVYGQSAGDTITIKVSNSDGTVSSNSINETIVAAPTGGTITTSGSYRIHTFASSGTFVVASGTSITADHLVVAGGGGTGWDVGGGGGAGGKVYTTGATISAASYSIGIGSGGGSGQSNNTRGASGGNTGALGITAIGGGGGGGHSASNIANGAGGGSGGGGGTNTGTGGAGTSGQGHDGGDADTTSWGTGGGGGAGADDAANGSGGGSSTGYVQGGSPYVSSISGASYT